MCTKITKQLLCFNIIKCAKVEFLEENKDPCYIPCPYSPCPYVNLQSEQHRVRRGGSGGGEGGVLNFALFIYSGNQHVLTVTGFEVGSLLLLLLLLLL